MSDFIESVRALDAANTARRDLVALVGMIVYAESTGITMQAIVDMAWQARSRLGMSRADWEIEMASRRVESEIAVLLAGLAIEHDDGFSEDDIAHELRRLGLDPAYRHVAIDSLAKQHQTSVEA